MTTTAGKQERFHFLDGLRGIASLMIVFHHSFTAAIAKAMDNAGIPFAGFYFRYFTQSGVELFFVLSGIVLLRPYLRHERRLSVPQYFQRRFTRIYPPFIVALFLAAGISWFINAFPTWYSARVFHMPLDWKEVLREALIINVKIDGKYWSYNLAWWSLGIEVLFYLVVPLIILLFPGRRPVTSARAAVMIVGTLAVSVALQLFSTKYFPGVYSYDKVVTDIFQFICYPVCFLMGILLAVRDFSTREARILIVCGVPLVIASIYYLPFVNPGYGLIYAGLIILSFNRDSFKHFLSRPFMIWLGERSYSLFLVHFSVFYLTDAVVAHFTPSNNAYYGMLSRLIGIPAAFFVAMLLFHFVEKKYARGLATADIFWPWQVWSAKGKAAFAAHGIH
jgi:peptidoglycan/LPS O-acetylase OafA/YrhL